MSLKAGWFDPFPLNDKPRDCFPRTVLHTWTDKEMHLFPEVSQA